MARRGKSVDPAQIAGAVAHVRGGGRDREMLKLLTRHLLAVLAERAPGGAVEVRVPPYGVTQCVEGTRHTRGTPPAVVETDPQTWVELALGEATWESAVADGRLRASGERSDLSALLPLV